MAARSDLSLTPIASMGSVTPRGEHRAIKLLAPGDTLVTGPCSYHVKVAAGHVALTSDRDIVIDGRRGYPAAGLRHYPWNLIRFRPA